MTYDITNRDSFENLTDWVDLVQKVRPGSDGKPPLLALMANKCTLDTRVQKCDRRRVTAIKPQTTEDEQRKARPNLLTRA